MGRDSHVGESHQIDAASPVLLVFALAQGAQDVVTPPEWGGRHAAAARHCWHTGLTGLHFKCQYLVYTRA